MGFHMQHTSHSIAALIDSALHDIGDEISFGSHRPPIEMVFEIDNTGAALTGFALMIKAHSDSNWVPLLQTTLWDAATGVLQGFSGTIKTLASGAKAIAVVRPGPCFKAKFQASIASGSRSVGTLTAAANPTNAKATATLSLVTAVPVAAETVTIGAKTYTWRASPTTVANEVKIGATMADSCDNLVAAIMGAAGSGSLYGSGTVASTEFTAARASNTVVCTAILRGTAGNALASTETMTNGSFGGATFAGGTLETVTLDDQVYTLKHTDNLVATNDVEIGATKEDTLDNLVTKCNATQTKLTCARSSATMVATINSDISATVGNAIVSTETAANISWGGSTLAGGVTTALSILCATKCEE